MENVMSVEEQTRENNKYIEYVEDLKDVFIRENAICDTIETIDYVQLCKYRDILLSNRTSNKEFDFNDFSLKNMQDMFLQNLDAFDVECIKNAIYNKGWTLEKLYDVVSKGVTIEGINNHTFHTNVLQLTGIKYSDYVKNHNLE
ncbi:MULTISPECIES: hypothetical protein [Clostridium]|uniref:hypothetical protein n=1 Tax=Clostridium TaxID=1485 RepID=UPI0008242B98|nr:MULTISPECIES: hypothetical protein [Clostridium]PJI07667.1 hypothetical protein CUB90_07225 [Clostridium sp. CT7]